MTKVIVIGMDNTGKTTLCETLSNKLDFELIKSPGPKITKEEMVKFMEENLTSDKNLIFERFPFIEEMVYGKILRHTNLFDFREPIVDKLKEVKFIYCRPNKKCIFNFGEREQMEGVIEQSIPLLKKFDRIYRKLKNREIKVIKYDYNKMNVDEVMKFITEE